MTHKFNTRCLRAAGGGTPQHINTMTTPGARSMVTSIVMFLACNAGIMGRAAASQTTPGNFEESFTYDFIVNVVNSDAAIGPEPYYVKLDGELPSVDQFTVHVAPDRATCAALTGGSCVAGVPGFIDGDELTQSSFHKGSTTCLLYTSPSPRD